ncbi:DUF4007 family protein [Methylotuvimicrobium buryatense]|uniref:DUF4007 family protein n=1 Tax=Methylotuvimicrobium buryatense TaxID=95641 RepID=A0A4V1IJP3_METBY|nr:DUF4007 family protein [Methylotuvimicrobium buryatense]QCW82105.1 DUF4007 family protein [Methylotuvimicrobium buryatense]
MNNQEILNTFKSIRVYKENDQISLHKPILLLYALAQCFHGKDRLLGFQGIDNAFQDIFLKLDIQGKSENAHYPFGKLENDGIWEVTGSKILKRTSVGHLYKKELLDNNVTGGFIEEVYNAFNQDKEILRSVFNYILETYIDPKLHDKVFALLNITEKQCLFEYRKSPMALIGNQTFSLSRFWTSKTIDLVRKNRNLFSKNNFRETQKALIAGSGVVKGIQGWMQASQLINKIKAGEYELTDFARSIYSNDPVLNKSSTWWAIHISICFSERNEPYAAFFQSLDNLSKDWLKWDSLKNRINLVIEDAAKGSLDSNLQGVRGMFQNDRPLADLGLIEIRKNHEDDKQIQVRLGSPKLTDEIIIHALAMLKFHSFKSRSTVDFSEIIKAGFAHFLCCSPEELRQHLRRMNQTNTWKDYFSFTEAVNLDSVSFTERCDPKITLLPLLQYGNDTWL